MFTKLIRNYSTIDFKLFQLVFSFLFAGFPEIFYAFQMFVVIVNRILNLIIIYEISNILIKYVKATNI